MGSQELCGPAGDDLYGGGGPQRRRAGGEQRWQIRPKSENDKMLRNGPFKRAPKLLGATREVPEGREEPEAAGEAPTTVKLPEPRKKKWGDGLSMK